MQKVSGRTVGTTATDSESALPAEVQRRLGELIEAASEGLLALSVGAGLRLVHELMELEVEALAGPKGKHDAGRIVKRQGYEQGSVTLGGRRVPVRRPRVKRVDDGRELALATYEFFACRGPLARAVMDRMLAGVSTRKFARVAEPGRHGCRGLVVGDVEDDGLGDVHRAHPQRARRALASERRR